MSAPEPGPATWSSPAPPASAPSAPSAPAARRSPLAVVAFVAGVATALVSALFTLAVPLVLSTSGFSYGALGALQLVNGVLGSALAITAVVTGSVALVRRQPGAALAGAGTALGASTLLGVVLGLVQGGLYQLF